MDVKNAFLNGDLTAKVYMQASLGYSGCPHKVVFFVALFMVLSKLLDPSLPSLAVLCISLASHLVPMIQHCLSADLIRV